MQREPSIHPTNEEFAAETAVRDSHSKTRSLRLLALRSSAEGGGSLTHCGSLMRTAAAATAAVVPDARVMNRNHDAEAEATAGTKLYTDDTEHGPQACQCDPRPHCLSGSKATWTQGHLDPRPRGPKVTWIQGHTGAGLQSLCKTWNPGHVKSISRGSKVKWVKATCADFWLAS